MTSVFPNVNPKQIIKVVKQLDFEFIRQSGNSHTIYRRTRDNKRTTIPIHGKKSLKRKTVKSICTDIGISLEQLKSFI